MYGLTVVAAWFVGLFALAGLEAKHGDAGTVGKLSIFVMVVVGFAAVLLADWIVFPVAAIAIAMYFVPVDPKTIQERRAAGDAADLEGERQLRRDELRQVEEDRALGLISEDEYKEQVAIITRPREKP